MLLVTFCWLLTYWVYLVWSGLGRSRIIRFVDVSSSLTCWFIVLGGDCRLLCLCWFGLQAPTSGFVFQRRCSDCAAGCNWIYWHCCMLPTLLAFRFRADVFCCEPICWMGLLQSTPQFLGWSVFSSLTCFAANRSVEWDCCNRLATFLWSVFSSWIVISYGPLAVVPSLFVYSLCLHSRGRSFGTRMSGSRTCL